MQKNRPQNTPCCVLITFNHNGVGDIWQICDIDPLLCYVLYSNYAMQRVCLILCKGRVFMPTYACICTKLFFVVSSDVCLSIFIRIMCAMLYCELKVSVYWLCYDT